MKTLVLDSTELHRDWLFRGAIAQLLEHAISKTIEGVAIPGPVVEELVANHERQSDEALARLNKAAVDCQRLGILDALPRPVPLNYREYVTEAWDERLGFTILRWPSISHQELVNRATTRTPPFDHKGGGYRDALVWHSVLELAKAGKEVVLVSADRAFTDGGQSLAQSLHEETTSLAGSVELVRELAPWLLGHLPWESVSTDDALLNARDDVFRTYFLESDFQEQLTPDAEAIGFDRAPYRFEVDGVEWSGRLDRVSARRTDGGANFIQYDIGEMVEFTALLPEGSRIESTWGISPAPYPAQVRVQGSADLTLRVGVLFDADASFALDDLSWRRTDGSATGPAVQSHDPGPALFDL
ncbi:PIN domain-containing protein [Microbacterium sp. NPDC056052]|uniref:PIN domain-containing protein n=1 Tax=Microbacterium sp. NPDC056052 TaxID=3345695 RepID=UPI0035E04D06